MPAKRASRSGRVAPANDAGVFADEVTLPLLGKDGATVATSVTPGERESAAEGADHAKPTAAQVLKWAVVLLASGADAAASIASFILSPAIMVYVAGALCLMNFPMVIYKENKILFLSRWRQAVTQLEDTAEFLRREAENLKDDIEYLLGNAMRFGEIEQELKEVAKEQGCDIEELLELIRLNEETMELMRKNLRQKVIGDVIEIVLKSEKKGNQGVGRVEAKLLALKISVKLEAYGIIFDDDKFLRAAALNPTIWGIAGILRKLLPPQDEDHVDGTSVTSLGSDDEDIYDMFYMLREGQHGDGSPLAAKSAADRVSLATRGKHSPLVRASHPGESTVET